MSPRDPPIVSRKPSTVEPVLRSSEPLSTSTKLSEHGREFLAPGD